MSFYEDKAASLFRSGCNCAQSVFTAFADKLGIDEKTALRMSSSFGAGYGRLREVCGAVSSMCLITGILYGYDDITDPEVKAKHYEFTASLCNKFKAEMGSYICREILGLTDYVYSSVAEPRTEEFYKTRPCEKCIRTAARIIEDIINGHDAT